MDLVRRTGRAARRAQRVCSTARPSVALIGCAGEHRVALRLDAAFARQVGSRKRSVAASTRFFDRSAKTSGASHANDLEAVRVARERLAQVEAAAVRLVMAARARPRRRCGRSASMQAASCQGKSLRSSRRGAPPSEPIDVAEGAAVCTSSAAARTPAIAARHSDVARLMRRTPAASSVGEVPRLALHADHEVDRLRHRGADRAHRVEVGQRRREQHVGAGRLVRLQARDRVGEVGLAAEEVLGARGDREPANGSARAACTAAAMRAAASSIG